MTPFRLDGRLVEPSLNRIDHASVEPKVMQVLVALAARPGQVVTRDELLAAAWPGVFVSDDALQRAIREIRRAFGDDAEAARVVETIRKRGYRLIGTVEPLPRRPPRRVAVAALLVVSTAAGGAIAWLVLGRHAAVATEARMRFVPLTSDPGNEVAPALSPDGRRLAYIARAADGQARVFVKSTAGGDASAITGGDGHDTAPVWSPDGEHIAYAHVSGAGCVLRTIGAGGGAPRDIGPCGAGESRDMSWSADGRTLAISSRAAQGGPYRLELLDLATGARRALTDPPAGALGDDTPAFSPDGSQIAFLRSISGSIGDLFIVPAAGGLPSRVTADNADVIGVAWEPDGRHLVFSSDRAGGISLFRVDVRGGEPRLVTGGGAKLKHPSVARTGAVAFESWHYDINIADVTLADGSRRAISPTTDQWNFHPQISPDGSRIAFQSTRSGPYEIWTAERDGQHAKPLTDSRVYKSMPRWSPDGRTLVFVARPADAAELTIVDVATGRSRVVRTEAQGLAAPSFSHDGSHVYVGAPRGGVWQIWRTSLADGAVESVVPDGGYAALESLDGRWLYFTRFGRRGLWRRPVNGGPEESIARDVAPEDSANWGVLDRGVFFLTRPDDDDPLLTVSRPGVATDAAVRLVDYAWSGIAMPADGRDVLYARADHRDANIVGLQFVR